MSLGHNVEVLAKFDFVLSKLSELSVVEGHRNFVVDVGPLGSETVSGAVVGVTSDEVRSLGEISEFVLFLESSLLGEGPRSSQGSDSLFRGC